MLLNSTDLLLGLFYKVDVVVPPFPRFHPVQRSSTLTSIQSFERSHLDTLMIAIIIREFSEWQPFLPRAFARDKASPKHVLKNLINTLGLPQCLWMISRTTD
jgi:hypothetical protein